MNEKEAMIEKLKGKDVRLCPECGKYRVSEYITTVRGRKIYYTDCHCILLGEADEYYEREGSSTGKT